MLRREPKERGLVSAYIYGVSILYHPLLHVLVCVLKITVLGQVIVWRTQEPRQHGRNRSARWIGETRCIRTNEDKACSLRVRAGFYWIRVNKCLNTTKPLPVSLIHS